MQSLYPSHPQRIVVAVFDQPAVLYVMGLAMDVTRQGRASTVPPPDGVELENR